MKNIEDGEARKITLHEIEGIAKFFKELPPGFEGMKQWLDEPATSTGLKNGIRHQAVIASFDPDAYDPSEGFNTDEDEASYNREHWRPKVDGALPELDAKLGAGEGVVGDLINIPVGSGNVAGHRVVGEWLFPEEYLRTQAKVSPNHSIVLEVIGDSMQPNYLPGDRVLIDLSQDRFTMDTVYAISYGYGDPQIKRLQQVPFSEPQEVMIISDNPGYKVFTVPLARLKIIGRICGQVSRR
ncbi:helix-turn-helix transcriptional regulator [Rhizobium lusitanum]|nr:helix-turn-helix transcriptional regulator [Rhizobium lusitanum]